MLVKHLTATAIVCVFCLPASAQTGTSQDVDTLREIVPGVRALNYGWAPNYSSTLQEGVLRGYGELWRGYGESVRSQAEGACFAEQARARSLENRRREVTQHFELRMLNQSYRRALRGGSMHSSHDTLPVSHKPTKSRRSSQLSPTGQIDWPVALQSRECDAARQQIEAAFVRRAAGAEIRSGSSEYRQVRLAIGQMLDDLKSRVSDMMASEYMTAKSLLTGLRSEITRTQPVQYTQN